MSVWLQVSENMNMKQCISKSVWRDQDHRAAQGQGVFLIISLLQNLLSICVSVKKVLISDIMQNVKSKYPHIEKSNSPPEALYITADWLPVAVQDKSAYWDNVSPHDQYLSLSPS